MISLLGEILHKQLRSSHLFRSQIALDIIGDSVRQAVEYSLELSRDLLLLCTLITNVSSQVRLDF